MWTEQPEKVMIVQGCYRFQGKKIFLKSISCGSNKLRMDMSSRCNSRGCRKCGSKHLTSLYETSRYYTIQKQQSKDLKCKEKGMGAINTASKLVSLHFKVLASANCLEFCILFKSDLSRSYTCTKLISALYLKPVKTERKITE